MNARQISKVKRNSKVVTLLENNIGIVEKVPVFYSYFGELKANVKAIEITGARQQQNLEGFTRDKIKVRKLLQDQVCEISSALCSFANANKNNTLHELVYCTPSSLDAMGYEDILFFSRTLLHEAEENNDALVANAIDEQALQSYKLLVEEYAGIISSPDMEGDSRQALGTLLVTLFKENDLLHKKKMLPAARVFRKTHPEFYTKYLLSLRSTNPRTINSQAAGFITNKVTGKILRGASVIAEGTSYHTLSNNKGKYRLKIPESGFYTLVIELEGYEPQRVTEVEISIGKVFTADVQLKPLF